MVKPTPTSLKKIDNRTLGILWDDGHESLFDTTYLRENCTCANCLDEWTGERKIMPGQLPKTVTPIAIDSVGQYGLTIRWSDGHSTGIYTYEHLRKLCQCPSCRR
ncbi:MAG: DUF971 domain-containing protein [Deltaproteobacteria bacterium]|nr:DUF971 domain-containing protein [Deltaproteobacteria bacterium]